MAGISSLHSIRTTCRNSSGTRPGPPGITSAAAPSPPISPTGRYVLGINASTYRVQRYFQEERALSFTVDATEAPGTQWYEVRLGTLRPRLDWQILDGEKGYYRGSEVTVLMAVYNGELFLPAAIESVLNRTFTDFEFIIFDDASTDATPEILHAIQDRVCASSGTRRM